MSPLPEEMVAAWLNGEDCVLSATGAPSWKSLIQALRDIDQPGIAQRIEEGGCGTKLLPRSQITC